MVPHPSEFARADENGIRRVVEAYFRHLPDYDIELVEPKTTTYDIKVVHAGVSAGADVAHCHGLYWTEDYAAAVWEWHANRRVIDSLREARRITVPSAWVAESLQRDMRLNPEVLGHGIDLGEWETPVEQEGWVLWNKNRVGDVCDPRPAADLAMRFPGQKFLATFGAPVTPDNMRICGVRPHGEMRRIVAASAVYLSTTKETFGIGTLEAMAAGVPVLGWAQGGNLELVRHGVNGYLARPGNMDDLAAGLDYCLTHRKQLGENGRELAKARTWEKVIERVAAIYREAKEPETPSVSIIIPTYNYGTVVSRAIESARAQDYPLLEAIIVVDDGSPDEEATRQAVSEQASADKRVRYIRQDNAGVAVARNRGIAEANTKYVCCLDADDTIDPPFLRTCIVQLEADRSLGIAYTALRYVRPDGREGVSDWPGEWDFDAQLARRNQVPTCCVFRHDMWERLGGYRSRYAPKGAGAEDAEFWLRSGAYGWGAKLATAEPLFFYRWGSGHVTGDKEYREVDWLFWHPWTRDGKHPFASRAKPKGYSHAVRQYDEPLISVVIPVGPGHERLVGDALDSLEAQTFRRWEAIVVWDQPSAPPKSLKNCYPYVRWAETGGNRGAGASRNAGRLQARAPFLVFLDADDYLHPDAFTDFVDAWNKQEGIVYSDYVGRAIIGDVGALAPALRERVYQHDGKTGEAVIGYRAAEYDVGRAQEQPDPANPYLWCNVTCLVPVAWHDEIGGFDERMRSWEDVDYHWRMAKAGKCYTLVRKELLAYRFSTGGRRERGLQEHREIVEYLRAKYREIPNLGCNCGGGNGGIITPANGAATVAALGEASMSDGDYVLSKYIHPNRGVHGVTGASTRTDYGYRAGGDVFLVHKNDIASQPHLFVPMEALVPPAAAPPPPPPAPQPVTAVAAPVPLAVPTTGTDTEPKEGIDWARPRAAGRRSKAKA
jgi:glycosyltransferase involved in cell wall biosynthesis